jgi:hypothetical protein
MRTAFRAITISCVAIVALSIAGCSGGGAATPEAAFENFKSAMKNKDFKTAFAQTTPDSQDIMIGGFSMALPMAAADPQKGPKSAEELKKILDQHGVKPIDFSQFKPTQDPRSIFKEASAGVKDKPACLADIITWVTTNDKNSSMGFEKFSATTLSDVKTEGDTATGTLKSDAAGPGPQTDFMKFKRLDGAWFIDLAGMMPGMPASGPGAQ